MNRGERADDHAIVNNQDDAWDGREHAERERRKPDFSKVAG
jgi:hypothetical protein